MAGNFLHNSLTMKKNKYGWGIYSTTFIPKNTLIERAIMYKMFNVDGNENPHLFTWSDDRKVWAGGTGLTPFYNYSDKPNIKKIGDLPNYILHIYTIKDIEPDEELVSTYFSKKWRKCFQDF